MKKILFFAIVALAFASCSEKTKNRIFFMFYN